jgi:predicted unusual protein kinase regulating ubiquinone biosynthesis (AarF/ABC1/UbiB family)
MKSNLAPINEEMIKAYLYDAVKNSNGQIKNIAVKKSLGAASVGQALLCEIEDKDDNKKECVVKLLRPDVYNRAMREKEIFEQAAREVPGMEITFDGQLKSIMDELDLTKEAENVEDGKVYNNTFNDVKSMNIIRPPEPTKNVLILGKAPGQTIDSYINKDKEGSVYKNIEGIIDEIKNRENKVVTQDEVVRIKDALDELLRAQRALINLSTLWVIKGIYGNGFYPGI